MRDNGAPRYGGAADSGDDGPSCRRAASLRALKDWPRISNYVRISIYLHDYIKLLLLCIKSIYLFICTCVENGMRVMSCINMHCARVYTGRV